MQRRTARHPVNGQLAIAIRGMDLSVELRDLSFGGFAIVAPRQFWRGMTHWFTFSTPAGRTVTLVAKAVHCAPVQNDPQAVNTPRFLSGWEFMAGTSEKNEKAIGELLSALW